MPKTKNALPNAFATLKVTIDIVMPVGNLSLEDALARARALKLEDILDVPSGTDVNDYSITVEGVNAY